MFGPPGVAYVYMIYGLYFCLNIVTEREGHASAVLLRALEPVANVSGKTSGPGLLCNALGITRQCNGHDLLSDDLYIADAGCSGAAAKRRGVAGAEPPSADFRIVKRPRIGVDYAGIWARRHLRFYIQGNPFISRL
jgi:DNA-3-methyladenine glycosylase